MKKVFKFAGYTILTLILIVAGAITYVKVALPSVGEAQKLAITYTPERVERGRYLANSVTICMDCHSTRDWSKFSGPLTPGTLGVGGERFDQTVGFPGVYYSKNITPAGISRYTDGELFRLITTGVTKEGRAMFPVMPYKNYGKLDPEDIYSIIAYIRSLPAQPTQVPESVSDFPMNFILNTIPSKASPQKMPPPSDRLAYGKYLVTASSCIECHTQVDKGKIIEDLAFSGGREFPFPDGSVVRSANLTPDQETGLGSWTEDMFVNKFRAFADSTYQPPSVSPGEFNSIMPWTMYGHMTKEDITAIYTYLKSLKPISHKVEKFTPAHKSM
ncbi:c-type cytochrome [Flavihumibacter fluvii]|uniref:c-type cytochrome n=1 Tax=Flavihumibacter fluvii TaxID=2838157 RepID=UPI001BDEA10A|nr:c-type cytochrome [Flavihumibacter fluvii]ULQ53181.1 c-type cytochrome [Flavihumibacter fluvii]